jgi:hypothetical protein
LVSRARLALVVLAPSFAVGCGAFQFTASTTGGASGQGPNGGAASGSSPGAGGRVGTAYAAWSYEQCTKGLWECSIDFAKTAGDPYNASSNPSYEGDPRSEANPDPEWLPGWDKLPTGQRSASTVYDAVTLAANRKTWLKACHTKFDAYLADQEASRAKVKPLIDAANAKTNVYEKLQAFNDIPRGAFVRPNDVARFELESATAKAYSDAGRGVTYASERYAPTGSLRAMLDKDTERDAFCMAVARGDVTVGDGHEVSLLMPKAPDEGSDATVQSVVKPLFDPARAKDVSERVAAAKTEAQTLFAMKDAKRPESQLGGKVKTVEKKGDATIVTLYGEASGVHEDRSRCVRVGAVSVRCPTVNTKTETFTTVSFAALPSSVSLQAGDELALWGKELSRKSTTAPRGSEVVETVNIVFEPAFLDAFSRSGKWTKVPTAGALEHAR